LLSIFSLRLGLESPTAAGRVCPIVDNRAPSGLDRMGLTLSFSKSAMQESAAAQEIRS
jgi:hypothetical protein